MSLKLKLRLSLIFNFWNLVREHQLPADPWFSVMLSLKLIIVFTCDCTLYCNLPSSWPQFLFYKYHQCLAVFFISIKFYLNILFPIYYDLTYTWVRSFRKTVLILLFPLDIYFLMFYMFFINSNFFRKKHATIQPNRSERRINR